MKMKFKIQTSKLKNKKGYLLVEVMIAISLLTLGFFGTLSLISNSISLNSVVSDHFIANYLAMEGIETVKNLIDANFFKSNPWNLGFTNGNFEIDYQSAALKSDSGQPILFDSASGLYGYQSGNPSPFKRTIKVDFININEMKVNSIVSWTGRGNSKFEINLEDHFFNNK